MENFNLLPGLLLEKLIIFKSSDAQNTALEPSPAVPSPSSPVELVPCMRIKTGKRVLTVRLGNYPVIIHPKDSINVEVFLSEQGKLN